MSISPTHFNQKIKEDLRVNCLESLKLAISLQYDGKYYDYGKRSRI